MKIKDYVFSHAIEMDIPFFDVDSMNVTWHGHYVKYFEMARCALLEKLGYDYVQMKQSGYLWPIVDMRVKYIRPTYFSQKIVVEAFITEHESRLKINYLIKDKISGERLTTAYTIQVAIAVATNEMCFTTPPVFKQKIEEVL